MKTYLGNAFSLQMLNVGKGITVNVTQVDAAEVADSNFISVIGHADTAAVVSSLLSNCANIEVLVNRASITLEPGDVLYVAQVVGGRLPEGSTTLPEGFRIEFLKVSI